MLGSFAHKSEAVAATIGVEKDVLERGEGGGVPDQGQERDGEQADLRGALAVGGGGGQRRRGLPAERLEVPVEAFGPAVEVADIAGVLALLRRDELLGAGHHALDDGLRRFGGGGQGEREEKRPGHEAAAASLWPTEK